MNLNIIYLRVGTTRSGKMIPCALDAENTGDILKFFLDNFFSDDDLLDVFAVYEYLALRAKRRKESVTIFSDHAGAVMGIIPASSFVAAKQRAKVGSAFELRDLGQSRAGEEFADL